MDEVEREVKASNVFHGKGFSTKLSLILFSLEDKDVGAKIHSTLLLPWNDFTLHKTLSFFYLWVSTFFLSVWGRHGSAITSCLPSQSCNNMQDREVNCSIGVERKDLTQQTTHPLALLSKGAHFKRWKHKFFFTGKITILHSYKAACFRHDMSVFEVLETKSEKSRITAYILWKKCLQKSNLSRCHLVIKSKWVFEKGNYREMRSTVWKIHALSI